MHCSLLAAILFHLIFKKKTEVSYHTRLTIRRNIKPHVTEFSFDIQLFRIIADKNFRRVPDKFLLRTNPLIDRAKENFRAFLSRWIHFFFYFFEKKNREEGSTSAIKERAEGTTFARLPYKLSINH